MKHSSSIQQLLINQISIPQLLFTSYKKLGLKEEDVIVILQLQRYIQEGVEFPTPKQLTKYLTLNETETMNIIKKLMQKGYLSIEESANEKNQLTESYNLDPLWIKLVDSAKNVEVDHQKDELDINVFLLFEQEFARPLTPIEIEMINAWLDEDKFQLSLIKAALREAVLMSKLNFKYIDRILREWQKKGVKTVDDAREVGKHFRSRPNEAKYEVNEEREEQDPSIYFNWLQGGDK